MFFLFFGYCRSGPDWVVVLQYYYEPGTGKMFRSLISVYKYLREGKTDTPMTKKLRADKKRSMQIIPYTIRSTSSFILPDDWIIEEKHRSNANYAGVIDKYYIKPGSGQRFCSLRAVERYLTEASKDTMPLKAFKDAHKLDCCDHPYLYDQLVQAFLNKGLEAVEYLDVGVKASAKLQLLDMMLLEIKKRGLRVFILFQSITGGTDYGRTSIGDILDDFLRQRFGTDCYERVEWGILPAKRQPALNKFNGKEHIC